MKIMQINAVGQTMSTGRTCKELQNYINNNTEHKCYTAFAQGVEDQYSIRIGNPIDWKFHGLFSRIFGKQAYFSKHSTRKLLQYMDKLMPDVVILRNVHGNYLNLPMVLHYLASKNIATVAVLHDCWFYTGKCTHYTIDKCYRWQTGCHNCPHLKQDNPSWFFDTTPLLWRNKKKFFEKIPRLAVVGVSDWITNESRKSFLSCAKAIERIYNWIDLTSFSPRSNIDEIRSKYGLKNEKIILGVASGWCKDKGLDKFISIANSIENDYQIVLVGDIVEDVILPANVLNIPATSSTEALAEIYSMANVFVTTSLEESFGKVSAEALACGTPVVCFDSTANRELVGNGCGYAVPPNDLQAMIAAIQNICSFPKTKYSDACRMFAQDNFDKEKNIVKYMQLFERIL